MVRSISVAMATYNGQKYIREQLDSILSQSYPVSEIIIVDDCSFDNTYNIICEYSAVNPKVKVMQNESNLGVLKTFEKALMSCSGDFIAVSDQDDVWLPNKIEELVRQIGDNYLLYSDAVVVDEDLKVINNSNLSFFERLSSFERLDDYFLANNVTGCTMLVSNELIRLVCPFPDFKVMYHDQYLAIMAKYFGKIKKVQQALILYRQHSNNVSASFNRGAYEKFINKYANLASDLYKLKQINLFESNPLILSSIDNARNFFLAVAHKRYPRLKLIKYCYVVFNLRMFFWFLRMACLGKLFAQLNYNLVTVKDKIISFLK
jgi:glycosyltransferase involved in cell wall biosynthesis